MVANERLVRRVSEAVADIVDSEGLGSPAAAVERLPQPRVSFLQRWVPADGSPSAIKVYIDESGCLVIVGRRGRGVKICGVIEKPDLPDPDGGVLDGN